MRLNHDDWVRKSTHSPLWFPANICSTAEISSHPPAVTVKALFIGFLSILSSSSSTFGSEELFNLDLLAGQRALVQQGTGAQCLHHPAEYSESLWHIGGVGGASVEEVMPYWEVCSKQKMQSFQGTPPHLGILFLLDNSEGAMKCGWFL